MRPHAEKDEIENPDSGNKFSESWSGGPGPWLYSYFIVPKCHPWRREIYPLERKRLTTHLSTGCAFVVGSRPPLRTTSNLSSFRSAFFIFSYYYSIRVQFAKDSALMLTSMFSTAIHLFQRMNLLADGSPIIHIHDCKIYPFVRDLEKKIQGKIKILLYMNFSF